jgi:hypothetical protein
VSSDEIRLSRKTVRVSWRKRSELAQRLEAVGYKDAAEDIRTRRAIVEARKPTVLLVIDRWLEEVGADEIGEDVLDFREELHYDVNERRGSLRQL